MSQTLGILNAWVLDFEKFKLTVIYGRSDRK